jgi:hypothetical protein
MFCKKCGNKIDKGDLFCAHCGLASQTTVSSYKKIEKPKTIFGRHQQLNFIKNLLGEKIADKELVQAIKKDSSEYDTIFDGLELIKSFIDSNGGTLNDNSVAKKVGQDIQALVKKGYDLCVLQNNPDLETECFGIYDEYDNRVLESVKRQNKDVGKYSNDLKEIRNILASKRYMTYQQLGDIDFSPSAFLGDEEYKTGKLITSPYQKAWWIIDAISPRNPNIGSMITYGVGLYCLTATNKALLLSDDILSFTKILIAKGKINPENMKVIEQHIALGKSYKKNSN